MQIIAQINLSCYFMHSFLITTDKLIIHQYKKKCLKLCKMIKMSKNEVSRLNNYQGQLDQSPNTSENYLVKFIYYGIKNRVSSLQDVKKIFDFIQLVILFIQPCIYVVLQVKTMINLNFDRNPFCFFRINILTPFKTKYQQFCDKKDFGRLF